VLVSPTATFLPFPPIASLAQDSSESSPPSPPLHGLQPPSPFNNHAHTSIHLFTRIHRVQTHLNAVHTFRDSGISDGQTTSPRWVREVASGRRLVRRGVIGGVGCGVGKTIRVVHQVEDKRELVASVHQKGEATPAYDGGSEMGFFRV
jgi:hypothetical protein